MAIANTVLVVPPTAAVLLMLWVAGMAGTVVAARMRRVGVGVPLLAALLFTPVAGLLAVALLPRESGAPRA